MGSYKTIHTNHGRVYPTHTNNLNVHIKLLFLAVLGFAILYSLSEMPYVAVLFLDIMFCGYLFSLFKHKYKYLFLLHPLILAISSQLYVIPFLSCGDGDAWLGVMSSYLTPDTFEFNGDALISHYGLIGFFKVASLGIVPIYAVPNYYFHNPDDAIFYLWQGTFHVFLCALVVTLARNWQVMNRTYLFSIALFAVLSPSLFDLGATPTRHVVTFFGVFLLLITHLAVGQRFAISRLFWFVTAVVMVLVSKAPLLIAYLLFLVFDLFFLRNKKLSGSDYLIFVLASLLLLVMASYFQGFVSYYAESEIEAGYTTIASQIPVVLWIEKYVYAFLAPFPWIKATYFIVYNYGGNWLLFIMHIFSSLSGLYLFFIVILKWRSISAEEIQLKQIVSFSVIMSLSILMGRTGFHSYLLIYFPMLAPLLTIKRYRINLLLPIGFVIFLEAIMLLVNL